MAQFTYYIEVVEKAIANSYISAEPQGLYQPINYTMELGGKRLRPALMLMCCEAFGAEHTRCINQAVGLEYFHNFTLLHDDVMDNADMRRSRPTVHKKWDVNTAILSGDTMLSIAYQYMLKADTDKITSIMDTFNKAAIEVYEGQQYDMEYEHRTDVTIDQYINMIRLKTSVLFGCACQIGAIVAGADKSEQQRIYDFGINLGLAFQLQDDFLDVYGDSATFGKEIGGDILNAKRTFMLISAYNRADQSQTKQLDELLDQTSAFTPAQRIAGVTEIYNQLAIPELCRAEIARHTQVAIDAVQSLNIAPEAKQSFENLVEKLMKRSR